MDSQGRSEVMDELAQEEVAQEEDKEDDTSESSSSSVDSPRFLHSDMVSHALCFLEARWICSFGCTAAWAASAFSVKHLRKGKFRRHWLETVASGDRVDAMDVEGRWFEAQILTATTQKLFLHYKSWNSSFDQTFDRSSARLAPLFTHCTDWRPKLKRGQLIEAKRDKAWYLAVVLKVGFDQQQRWSRLDAVGVKSSRDHDTLRVVSPNFPVDESPSFCCRNPDVLTWQVTDFDSEDIAPLGTHIRPGEVGKHYTTNSIIMPMSFLIDIMSQP